MHTYARTSFLLLALVACSRAPARTQAQAHTNAAPIALRQQVASKPVEPSIPRRVGGEVTAPVSITRVEPNYEGCAGKQVWGFPILEAVIDESGQVRDLKLLSKVHPCLAEAILPAVRQWRFKPGTYKGRPVPVIYNMTVHIHYR